MATSEDPRALLRAARKERRVTHPHASYTSTGNLLCNLCECPIKSEASWSAHLHSTGHTLRLSREQDAAIARKADASNGKKRKAGGPADGEGSDGEERKRMKGPDAPTSQNTTVGAESAPAPVKSRKGSKSSIPEVASSQSASSSGVEKLAAPLPRAIRSQTFSNAADPVLTADNVKVDKAVYDGKSEEKSHSAYRAPLRALARWLAGRGGASAGGRPGPRVGSLLRARARAWFQD